MKLKDLIPKELLPEALREDPRLKDALRSIQKAEKMLSDAAALISDARRKVPRDFDKIGNALGKLDSMLDPVTDLAQRIYIETKAKSRGTPLAPEFAKFHGIK